MTGPGERPVRVKPSARLSATSASVSGPISMRSAWEKNGWAWSVKSIRMVEGWDPANTIPSSR
ncbi:hypothetical protein KSP35_07860 [Aquihabitans sp. G128]|uniref:hypothetical protein n=1 Tax=Aquihabitans sp. G128 TaxID=2849779 RepID=UPI001C233023|nr:hypothetical protein [Aquihabitans sp. G128]QXC62697.1 hypothetical protein KSP35_07860 [Aquihabitans sp. G128]